MFTKEQTEQLTAPGRVAGLMTQVSNLEKEVAALRTAFDALFDVVAEELGYAPATFVSYGFGGFGGPYKHSPRQLAVTQPEPKLIRTKKRSK